MNNTLFRRARMLFGVGVGVGVGVGAVLLGLCASACGSSTAASGTTPIPTSSAESGPRNVAPTTSIPVTTARPAATTTQPPHTTSPIPKPVPILGTQWGVPGGQKGYGTAHPDTIFNGGDPTGLVTGVHWQSWGGPVAIASGMSYDPGNSIVANSVLRAVTVEAFNLGVCHGTLMYQAIEWYVPADGQKFDPHIYINICTGTYVGSR